MNKPFLEKVKLSLPVGLWIENCLTSGIPHEQLIQLIRQQDFATILPKVEDPQMDMIDRLHIAIQMNDPWAEAIREGYHFKFIHIGGVKRLLRFRFQLQEQIDYTQSGNHLSGLYLSADRIRILEERIGIQWEIVADLKTASYPNLMRIRLKNESC